MKISNKIKLIIFLLIIITIGYFFLNNAIKRNDSKFSNLKSLLSIDQKQLIIKYFFPHKLLTDGHIKELQFKESGNDIKTKKSVIKLSNSKILKKYRLKEGFYYGINNKDPGSGYIDFYEKNLFLLSSRGVLAFKKNLNDNKKFKQIKNNINEYIDSKQFKKHRWYSLKDLYIFKDKIFISYTEEIKENCWNTSIIFADINYENLMFKKLFSSKKCVHEIDNIDGEFSGHQSGGRIMGIDDNHILLTIGDYRSRYLAQDKKSVNGKIVKINIMSSNYKIISMGHRNPQGLLFDRENNFILSSEHGPEGGDEVNLIEVEKINQDIIQNYGWPISSYGEHAGGKTKESNIKRYEKYPFYKSHSKYGFIEPLTSFSPSIGISEIVKIGKNNYVVSSMKDRSLYFFELNEQRKIVNLDRVEVTERVRDLKFNKGKLYLFLEDTASIGVINFN